MTLIRYTFALAPSRLFIFAMMFVGHNAVAETAQKTILEKNKALVTNVFEALESGDVSIINDAFDPQGKSLIGLQERPRGGPFDTFKGAAPFPAALDDRSVIIESLFAENDRVAVQSKICGVHARELVGYQPTGMRLCARYTNLYTIENNRIIVNTVGFDPELRKTLERNKAAKSGNESSS